MNDGFEEGWFTDPYGLHEARWLSGGRPTKLVRDGDVESYEDPPDGPPTSTPVRLEADPEASNGGDLHRADEAESGPSFDGEKLGDAPWGYFEGTGGFRGDREP
jgi:hypothetical protein